MTEPKQDVVGVPELVVTEEDRKDAAELCNSGGILILGVLAEVRVANLLANERQLREAYAIIAQKDAELAALRSSSAQVRAEALQKLEEWKRLVSLAFELWDADQDWKCGKLLHALAGHAWGYRADVTALLAPISCETAFSLMPTEAERTTS